MIIKNDELISLLSEQSIVFEYAQNHFEQLRADAEKAEKIKYGSKCDGIGQISPSMIEFRRVKNMKKGRFLKEIPENPHYTVYAFGNDNSPKRLRKMNQYGCDMNVYFFELNGYQYAVPFFRDTDKGYPTNIFKYLCKDGRVMEYYQIERSHVIGERYDYDHFDEGYIDCYWFYYYDSSFSNISSELLEAVNSKLKEMGTSKKIQDDHNIVRRRDYCYRIFMKDKKITEIKEYIIKNENLEYIRDV